MKKHIIFALLFCLGTFLNELSLTAGETGKALSSTSPKKELFFAISDQIHSEPLLSTQDIVTYEWTNHTITIKPKAAVRLKKLTHAQLDGISCNVKLKGQKSYPAQLKWITNTSVQLTPHYPGTIAALENNILKNRLIRFNLITINGLLISYGESGKYRTRLTNEDYKKSLAAYKKIYDRYGRENYKSLRDDLLKNEKNFTLPGEFKAAIKIFRDAKDHESLIKTIAGLNPKVLRDYSSWYQMDNIIRNRGIKVWQAFIMVCPTEIYQPENVPFSYKQKYIELLNSGKAGKAEIATVEKLLDMCPELSMEFCKALKRDPKTWMNSINQKLKNDKKNTQNRRRNIKRMMSFIRYYTRSNKFHLSDFSEFSKFVSLLNLNIENEVFDYIDATAMLGMHDETIDILIRRIDQPVSDQEIKTATQFIQMIQPVEKQYNLVLEYRRKQLISYLLIANKTKEAQKWIDKFYGPNTDLSKIDLSSWRHITCRQKPRYNNIFEKILDKADPQTNKWEFYMNKYIYYSDTGNNKAALKSLRKAIQKGKEIGNHDLVVSANAQLVRHYSKIQQKKKALELARQNNEYAVKNANSGKRIGTKFGRIYGTAARHTAAGQLMNLLKEVKPYGWQSEWEKVARREFLDGQSALLRRFLWGKRRMNKDYTIAPDDEIFTTFCGDSFQKKNGFCAEVHAFRLEAVPFKDFEDCLKQTLNDFLKYKSSKNARPRLRCHFSGPHRKERKALLAKYLFDTFPYTFDYQMPYSLPARNYEEGKKLLNQYWADFKISSKHRRKALLVLLKKAPNQTEKNWCKTELAKFGNVVKK